MGKLFARTNLFTRLVIFGLRGDASCRRRHSYMQYNWRNDGEQRIADAALRRAELLNADMANVAKARVNSAWRSPILPPCAMATTPVAPSWRSRRAAAARRRQDTAQPLRIEDPI